MRIARWSGLARAPSQSACLVITVLSRLSGVWGRGRDRGANAPAFREPETCSRPVSGLSVPG